MFLMNIADLDLGCKGIPILLQDGRFSGIGRRAAREVETRLIAHKQGLVQEEIEREDSARTCITSINISPP